MLSLRSASPSDVIRLSVIPLPGPWPSGPVITASSFTQTSESTTAVDLCAARTAWSTPASNVGLIASALKQRPPQRDAAPVIWFSTTGYPPTIIVTTTVGELDASAGAALTGEGTLLPMSDVICMAGHADHYLATLDKGKAIGL